ncbi:MAG: hypothetical protein WAO35_19730 [Terriglobia bacterium]
MLLVLSVDTTPLKATWARANGDAPSIKRPTTALKKKLGREMNFRRCDGAKQGLTLLGKARKRRLALLRRSVSCSFLGSAKLHIVKAPFALGSLG